MNEPPGALSSDVSVSVNIRGSPIAFPKSSCQTGEVEVWNVFEIRSVEPAGAEPVDPRVERAVGGRLEHRVVRLAVAALAAPVEGDSPRYSASTPSWKAGWKSIPPISNVNASPPVDQNDQSSVAPVVSYSPKPGMFE